MVQIAYLSVPSPGKWISDLFGKNMFRRLFDDFLDQHVLKKWTSEGSSGSSARLKSIVYWSSSHEVFTKIRVFFWNFSLNFQFFSKTLFCVFTYRELVLKKSDILGPFFEHCVLFVQDIFFWLYKTNNLLSVQDRQLRFSDLFLSLVPPVLPLIFFFRKKTISGKQRPPKGRF